MDGNQHTTLNKGQTGARPQENTIEQTLFNQAQKLGNTLQ
jgi:hypothetical protein